MCVLALMFSSAFDVSVLDKYLIALNGLGEVVAKYAGNVLEIKNFDESKDESGCMMEGR